MQIEIKRGRPPEAMVSRRAIATRMSPVHEAIKKLKPGEWFEIPWAVGLNKRVMGGLVGAINHLAKARGCDGVRASILKDDAGIVVAREQAAPSAATAPATKPSAPKPDVPPPVTIPPTSSVNPYGRATPRKRAP